MGAARARKNGRDHDRTVTGGSSYSDTPYSDISKWVMQWVRVRIRVRDSVTDRVRVRVRVRVSVSCACSEAFVGIGSVGIGTCTHCHYDATTILRRPSRSLRPHCVLIRFL